MENIYKISKKQALFKYYLEKNNIKISQILFNDLTSYKLKVYSYNLFKNLKSKNISVITIEDKNYPLKMLNIYLPMLCIYYNGSIDKIIKNKSIYLFIENTKNNYYKFVYKDFSTYLEKLKNINIIKFGNNKFFNKNVGIEIKYTDLNSFLKRKKFIKNNILIINNKKYRKEYLAEIISGISDLIIIPKARYNKFISFLTEGALEIGTSVLICPGSIYNKDTYFSNFLIKEGANVLLNKIDINNYF